ncbi:MAG: SH3 domain-containing protein [Alphaproteobacteria bacterium]
MKHFLCAMVLCTLLTGALQAKSGLPVPRFVSLKSDKINVRVGPGKRYPVLWVFTRRGLPVEITAEYDHWRKIRGPEGAEGWVHQSMLSGMRTVMVQEGESTLRKDKPLNAKPLAQLQTGIIAKVKKCSEEACKVEVEGFKGWLSTAGLWGVKHTEASG